MTTEKEYGKWLRSNPESFSLGDTVTFKTDFLKTELTKNTAPEVCEIKFDFDGTVDSAASVNDAKGIDCAKLVERVRLADDQPFVECCGEGLRLNAIIELGERYADMTTLAAGAANANRKWSLPIPYELIKAKRGRDYTFQLWHLAEGEASVTFAPALPTGWDGFTSGKVRMRVRVRNGRREEAHPRLVIRDQAMTLLEAPYNFKGSIRTAAMFTKLATTGMSDLSAYTTIDAVAFGYPSGMELDTLIDHYRRQTDGIHSSDPILAATPTVIPFVVPGRRQKIGSMMDIDSAVIDIKSAPPSYARLLTSVIMDRVPSQAARDIGQPSAAEYQAAAIAIGEVPNPAGSNKKWTSFSSTLKRRLPVRAPTIASESK